MGQRRGGCFTLLFIWDLLSLLEWWKGSGIRRACPVHPSTHPPALYSTSPLLTPLLTACSHPGGPNSASHSSLPPFKKRELGDLYVWGSLAQVDPRGVHTAGLKPQPQVGEGG